jgi:hypothetical protein
MNSTLHRLRRHFLASYIHLEKAVQMRMVQLCGPYCRSCLSPCCKIDFCRESRQSPFLRLITDRSPPPGKWTSRGWLKAKGCALTAGRPPVCYSFCCDIIALAQPTPAHRYALNVLSALISYTGRNAHGSRHLVELPALQDLNLDRLQRQCDTALAVLDHLDQFWRNPQTSSLSLELCKKIYRPHSRGVTPRQNRLAAGGR